MNLERKQKHMELLDSAMTMSREEWILNTALSGVHVELEPNLFPYETPPGVTHYTLWSRTYLSDGEVESFVESWLDQHRPNTEAWGWDPSNLMEGLSIDLFHVHVFLYENRTLEPKQAAVLLPSSSLSHKARLPLLD